MDIRLDGKKALITGGSKGLGLAMAKTFAEAGADVAILARNETHLRKAAEEIRSLAPARKVVSLVCDVTQAAPLKSSFEIALRELGGLNILVNNAGASFAKPFEELTAEDYQADFDLKFFAAVRLCRMAWEPLKASGSGRILNVLHVGAKAPGPRTGPSSVTRAAGMAFTKVLAGEGAPHHILVNGLMVGLIESHQWVRKAKEQNMGLEDLMKRMGEGLPMKRMGTAQEFANVACFLASDAASYLNGVAINVDGGMSPVV